MEKVARRENQVILYVCFAIGGLSQVSSLVVLTNPGFSPGNVRAKYLPREGILFAGHEVSKRGHFAPAETPSSRIDAKNIRNVRRCFSTRAFFVRFKRDSMNFPSNLKLTS